MTTAPKICACGLRTLRGADRCRACRPLYSTAREPSTLAPVPVTPALRYTCTECPARANGLFEHDGHVICGRCAHKYHVAEID